MQRDANNDGSPKTLYWLIMAMVAMCAIAMMSGCKTQERVVTVIEHRTDTVRENRTERDSIYVKDSVYIREKGDTVWIEKWHTRWRDVMKTDTVYMAKHDTLTSTITKTKEVEKPLTWWQKTRIYAGNVLLICLFVAAGFGGYRLWRKVRG